MIRRSALLFLALGVGASCLPAEVDTVARVPRPNIIGTIKGGGTFEIDVSSVPLQKVCSRQAGLEDVCVRGFRTSVRGGLQKVLDAYFDGAKPGPAYRTRFKFLRFSHSMRGSTTKVTLRWQFEMVDEAAGTRVQLAETTDGPEQLNDDAPAEAVEALLNAVMERIAAAIKVADFAPNEPPWPDSAPATDDGEPTEDATPPAAPGGN